MNTRQDDSIPLLRRQQLEESSPHDPLEQYTYSEQSLQPPVQVYTRGTTGVVKVRSSTTSSTNLLPQTASTSMMMMTTPTRKQQESQPQQVQSQSYGNQQSAVGTTDTASIASSSVGNGSYPSTPPLSGRSSTAKSRSNRSVSSTPSSGSRSLSYQQQQSKSTTNIVDALTSLTATSNNTRSSRGVGHYRSRSQEGLSTSDEERGRSRPQHRRSLSRGTNDGDDDNSKGTSDSAFRRNRSRVLSADAPRHRRKRSTSVNSNNNKDSGLRSTVRHANRSIDQQGGDNELRDKQQQHGLTSIVPHFPVELRDTTPSIYKEKLESNASTTNRSTRSSTTGMNGNNSVSTTGRDGSSSTSISRQTRELLKAHSKISRRVVDELNRAQSSDKNRIPAVTNACAVFDHDDEGRHNIELYYGAALALAKLLIVASKDDEIRMILSALEMVFRGSPKQCADAFGKVSHSLLSNLLRCLERFETRNVKHADVSILNISKILYYLSRSSELRSMLCRPKSMLQAMSRLSTRTLTPDSRLLWVRLVANLSNTDENKVLMYEQEGLVESLLRLGHFDSSDWVRQLAMTAIMEFSSAPTNQVSMAKNEILVSTVVKTVLVEKNATTRENAITTLQNLAFTKENRVKLVTLKRGIVLEALKKVLANDKDSKARRRAAGALTNLACEETAETMGDSKGLVNTLAIVATKDEKEDVQTRASLALTKIAGFVTVNMACHEAMLDALVVASLSKAPNSVAAVLRVKARAPENRETLARHSGVVDTLCDICVSDASQTSDRDNAIRAIMHLVNEDKNRKILCSKTILDALVVSANYTDPQLEEARESAVRGLERLATEQSNRHFMAHHPGLIVAVSKSVEREAISQREGRESEYGFLAKPLLLSLLLAM